MFKRMFKSYLKATLMAFLFSTFLMGASNVLIAQEETSQNSVNDIDSEQIVLNQNYKSVSNSVVASDDHDHSHEGWIEINADSNSTYLEEGILSSGNYYLNTDYSYTSIALSKTLTISGSDVSLCLNGYTLSRSTSTTSRVTTLINVSENSTFTLCDCSEENTGTLSGGSVTSNYEGGAITVHSSTFIMNGGTITKSSSTFGGGIYLFNSNFTMNGGTITSNTASYGGGIYFESYDSTNTFIINEGDVSSNNSTHGAGIYVTSYNSTLDFTINKATINENTADKDSLRIGKGAGIYFESYDSTTNFIINYAEISSNTTTGTYNGHGGGIYYSSSNSNGTFIIDYALINNNHAGCGAGVYYNSSSSNNEFIINDGEMNNNSGDTGCPIYYTAKYSTDEFIINGGEKNYNESNGQYNLYYSVTECSNLFEINGGELNGNNGTYYEYGIYYSASGTSNEFIINGGEICNNVTSANMYVIRAGGTGSFTINGGTISGNTSWSDYSVYSATDTFVLNGGYISDGTLRVSPSNNVSINAGYFDELAYNSISSLISEDSIYLEDANQELDPDYLEDFPYAVYKIGKVSLPSEYVCVDTDYEKYINLYGNVSSDYYSYEYQGSTVTTLPTALGQHEITFNFTQAFVTTGNIIPKEYYDGTSQTLSFTIIEHTYSDEYEYDEHYHYKDCINESVCDLVIEESIYYDEHDIDYVSYDDEHHYYGCTICDYGSGLLAEHNYTEWTTSTDDPTIEEKTCTDCNHTLTRQATEGDGDGDDTGDDDNDPTTPSDPNNPGTGDGDGGSGSTGSNDPVDDNSNPEDPTLFPFDTTSQSLFILHIVYGTVLVICLYAGFKATKSAEKEIEEDPLSNID